MPLNKAKGQMYPWVTDLHTHLGGECPHKCVYCCVQDMKKGFPAVKAKYSGPVRMIEKELDISYGKDKVIFVEHLNDLFAKDVPDTWILEILTHCCEYPCSEFVFQTKNPGRYQTIPFWPIDTILGTTIETNRTIKGVSEAPPPWERYIAMKHLKWPRKFVTIEPVLDFDVDVLAGWIAEIQPEFLNLGADSKGHGLVEPSLDKIEGLTVKLAEYGIELREKHNLERLKRSDPTREDGE